METHAHHLHKVPGKGLWHYLFEFLMLFLAVTLGFFVENQRETFIEHRRGNEYARSLYDDLKMDTFLIQRTLNEKEWIRAKYDTAVEILEMNTINNNTEFIYYVARYLSVNDAFTSQDVTYQQLRSSGNFRYIRNADLYKHIAEYYSLYSRYQSLDVFGVSRDENMPDLISKIFNISDFYKIKVGGNFTFYDLERHTEKLRPIKADAYSLKLLQYKFGYERDMAYNTGMFLNWLKLAATKLIKELEKEYPECR